MDIGTSLYNKEPTMGYPLQLESGKTVELVAEPPHEGNFVTTFGVGITTVHDQHFAIAYIMYFAEMQPRFYPVSIGKIRHMDREVAITVDTRPWLASPEPHVYTTPKPDSHGLAGLINSGYVLTRVADIEGEARMTLDRMQKRQLRERAYGYLKGVMEALDLLGRWDISIPYVYRATEAELVALAKTIGRVTQDLKELGAYFDGQVEGSWDALEYLNQLRTSQSDGSILIDPDRLINALLALIPQIRMVYAGQKPEGEQPHA